MYQAHLLRVLLAIAAVILAALVALIEAPFAGFCFFSGFIIVFSTLLLYDQKT